MPIDITQPLGSSFNPFAGTVQELLNEIGEAAARFEEIEEELNRVILLTIDPVAAEDLVGGQLVGRVTSTSGPFNATYSIDILPGQLGEEITLDNITPQGRMFDTDEVDFHAAFNGSVARVWPLPLSDSYDGPWHAPILGISGGCLFSDGCRPFSHGLCVQAGGVTMGLNSPCASVYITENVKISTCPAPSPSQQLPPPPVIRTPGLLA